MLDGALSMWDSGSQWMGEMDSYLGGFISLPTSPTLALFNSDTPPYDQGSVCARTHARAHMSIFLPLF